MTNESIDKPSISSSPSSGDHYRHESLDTVAQQRRSREWLKGKINSGHSSLERKVNQRIIDRKSRITRIRQPIETLQFRSEEYELECFHDYQKAHYDSSAYSAYVVEAVSKLSRQLVMLRTCAASSSPCKLMGCPKCSPAQRAEAVAEAATYLWEALQKRKFTRFFSLTITTDIWVLPLYKADEFMREAMAHTLRTLFGNLDICSDILVTIEGSLDGRLATPKTEMDQPRPAKGTLEYRMQQAVLWHLHGILVCDGKPVTKHRLRRDIESIFRLNNSGFSKIDVKVEPLKIFGLKRTPEQYNGERWLLYITKMLTADTFNADDRRAVRYALNDTYTCGLLSTGPILYRCRDLTHAEQYLSIKRANREDELKLVMNADSETLTQLVVDKLAELGLES